MRSHAITRGPHELKLIVDLMYQGGVSYMRYSVSDTAEYGDYHAGQRIVTDATRSAMAELLAAVRDGSFARQWIEEDRRGRPEFAARRAAGSAHQLETVGRAMRRMMAFLDAKEPPTVAPVAAPAAAEAVRPLVAGAA